MGEISITNYGTLSGDGTTKTKRITHATDGSVDECFDKAIEYLAEQRAEAKANPQNAGETAEAVG